MGESSLVVRYRLCYSEHPHRRGEKAGASPTKSQHLGTSPQAWGKVWRAKDEVGHCRNIPTGVGKSPWSPVSAPARAEHPHRRGEKSAFTVQIWARAGTSPQAWGKVGLHGPNLGEGRNIPTGVGKRDRRRAEGGQAAEHPHRRGEKKPNGNLQNVWYGTSPQAWGKGTDAETDGCNRRNIPTGVGKRDVRYCHTMMFPEHPHRRGEKFRSDNPDCRDAGTSPQAWGKETPRLD